MRDIIAMYEQAAKLPVTRLECSDGSTAYVHILLAERLCLRTNTRGICRADCLGT